MFYYHLSWVRLSLRVNQSFSERSLIECRLVLMGGQLRTKTLAMKVNLGLALVERLIAVWFSHSE